VNIIELVLLLLFQRLLSHAHIIELCYSCYLSTYYWTCVIL